MEFKRFYCKLKSKEYTNTFKFVHNEIKMCCLFEEIISNVNYTYKQMSKSTLQLVH